MTEQRDKARQIAEKAFDKPKIQSSDQARAREEIELDVKARQEKSARLREARLALAARNTTSDDPSRDAETTKS